MCRILFLFICCIVFHSVLANEGEKNRTSEEVRVMAFLERNPNMMRIECLQEENLYLAADDDSIIVVLELANPQLLLRFLMKGFSIYLDPTGKNKERFEIKLPATESLLSQEQNDNRGAEIFASTDSINEKPNVLPLIELLTKSGMEYTIKGKPVNEEHTAFYVHLDVDIDKLYYYMLLPINDYINEKKLAPEWTIGLYSPEIDKSPDKQPSHMIPPPPDRERGKNPTECTQEITQWVKFSFEQLTQL